MKRDERPRRWQARLVTTALCLVVVTAGSGAAGSQAAVKPPCATHVSGVAAAQAAARACGQAVEVPEATTATDVVSALPDGQMRLVRNMRPVRVRKGAGWVPIDSTLAFAPDGTVGPKAATFAMAFSGGGTGPLVRMTFQARTLTVGTPFGALPKPRLDGDKAIYSGVLPGVDLTLTAHDEGYTEVLTVHDRQA